MTTRSPTIVMANRNAVTATAMYAPNP